VEDIELQVLSTKEADEGSTPPADCSSSRNSDLEHSTLAVSVISSTPHKCNENCYKTPLRFTVRVFILPEVIPVVI